MTEDRAAAIELLRVGWVRFNHQPDGPDHMVTAACANGMIELMDMEGQFAPHLFIPVQLKPKGEDLHTLATELAATAQASESWKDLEATIHELQETAIVRSKVHAEADAAENEAIPIDRHDQS